jgi:polyhydroxyalkanoate synthesis regulator phasin
MIDYTTLLEIAGAVTTLGGAWITIRKITKDAQKAKKEHVAEILHAAKEADHEMRAELEIRIQKLESKLGNLEVSVEKDLSHLKEAYTSEIKNLGEKIEDLRNELRQQHAGLLDLLTKLVGKR